MRLPQIKSQTDLPGSLVFLTCSRLDLTFFVLFPILFLLFNILYWSAVMYWR
jgi:hypothetical protein